MTRALCVGTAASMRQEIEAAFALSDYDAFYVCNTAALRWSRGPFTWVSITPHMLPELMRQCSGSYQTLAPPDHDLQVPNSTPIDRRFSPRWAGHPVICGGLLAVEAALADGADRVVLAGMPLDGRAGHIRGICTPTAYDPAFALWQEAAPHLQGRVKSLSGRTRELLGEPTSEWLS